jgi:hypothetical protein
MNVAHGTLPEFNGGLFAQPASSSVGCERSWVVRDIRARIVGRLL